MGRHDRTRFWVPSSLPPPFMRVKGKIITGKNGARGFFPPSLSLSFSSSSKCNGRSKTCCRVPFVSFPPSAFPLSLSPSPAGHSKKEVEARTPKILLPLFFRRNSFFPFLDSVTGRKYWIDGGSEANTFFSFPPLFSPPSPRIRMRGDQEFTRGEPARDKAPPLFLLSPTLRESALSPWGRSDGFFTPLHLESWRFLPCQSLPPPSS